VHHVTHRGNHRENVFFAARDRLVYLRLLARSFQKYELPMLGYSLMDNHVHMAVMPKTKESLAQGVGLLHHDFARWQNIQRGTNGHLWQERFFSCPVEGDRVSAVLSYIELNPVRAKMVDTASDWQWSSARAHVSGTDPSGLLDMACWRDFFRQLNWRDFLEQSAADKSMIAQIRRATAKQHFLGSEETARTLESELGIPLLPRKPGPRRKQS
jgi:putative transposase